MTTYVYSNESPADVKAGLLIVPVFQGPKPGPGVRETGLSKAYGAARLTCIENGSTSFANSIVSRIVSCVSPGSPRMNVP